jgi:hypothetical protein
MKMGRKGEKRTHRHLLDFGGNSVLIGNARKEENYEQNNYSGKSASTSSPGGQGYSFSERGGLYNYKLSGFLGGREKRTTNYSNRGDQGTEEINNLMAGA